VKTSHGTDHQATDFEAIPQYSVGAGQLRQPNGFGGRNGSGKSNFVSEFSFLAEAVRHLLGSAEG
jgi:AAA15 family ATPase/GTPase